MPTAAVSWRLSSAPAPDEPAAPAPAPRRARWRWWALAALLVVGLIVWAFTTLGLRRLRAQLQHEAAYEDDQSRAGQATLALAVHAPDHAAWLAQRTAEVAAGLAAPLPAPGLTPRDTPPQAVRLRPLADNVYEVRVRRQYAGPDGAALAFDLWQRYHNLGPGLWQRLSPDEAALAENRTWSGRRLAVTAHAADWEVLAPLLPDVDDLLQRACADWACGDDVTVPITFTGQLAALPVLTPTVRPGDFGPYPLTFDVALNTIRPDGPLLIPTPRLTGLPADDAATAAYARGLQAQALVYLGQQVNSASRRTVDVFREALIAREAVRLGLSTPAAVPLSPEHYLDLESLWDMTRRVPAVPAAAEVAYRLQALGFLDQALAAQPAEADGDLLRTLRDSNRHLPGWLGALPGLGIAGAAGQMVAWEAAATARFSALAPADLTALDGLAFQCTDGLWLVRGGRLARLLPGDQFYSFSSEALSPDGRTVALVGLPGETNESTLYAFDLDRPHPEPLASGPGLQFLGWSAAGELVYTQQEPLENSLFGGQELWRVRPGSAPERLAPGYVFGYLNGHPIWSANRTQLALTLNTLDDRQFFVQAVTLVSLADGQVRQLPAQSFAGALSPDGRSLAYLQSHYDDGGGFVRTTIDVLPLAGGQPTTLFATDALDLGPGVFSHFYDLAWSPAGDYLAFTADSNNGLGTSLHLLRLRDGHVAPLSVESRSLLGPGFAADGAYVAFSTFADHAYEARTTVVPLGAAPQSYQGAWPAWSPGGHRLALIHDAGVYVVDPATGDVAWVKSGGCTHTAWWALGSR